MSSLRWICWGLLLTLLLALPRTGSAITRHTLMQEDVGYVDALNPDYGSTRSAATLIQAINAQGGNYATVFLSCGLWVLESNVVVQANLQIWIPACTTVQVQAGVTFTLLSAPLVTRPVWYTGPGQVVQNFVSTPPATAVGAIGTLQAHDGTGHLAAYSGSGPCSTPGTFMRELSSTGLAICGAEDSSLALVHVLTDRFEPAMPNNINLSAMPSGLVRSTPSGFSSAIDTVPMPAGGLAGLEGPQTLLQTLVSPRIQFLNPLLSTPVFDLSLTDMAVSSGLIQPTLFLNPIGSAVFGQMAWFSLHSAVPQALFWESIWTADSGLPLPTSTTGGSTHDLFMFLYNPALGKMVLGYNSQLLAGTPSITPGTCTCCTVAYNAHGQITAASTGTCSGGGGGSTPSGTAGDIQLNGGSSLAADSGTLTHDLARHITYTQGLQAGAGSGYAEFTDVRGLKGWLFPADLTSERAWKLPDASGELLTGSAMVVRADTQPGSDAGKKIAAAIALLPTVGGYVDGSHFSNPQNMTGFTIPPGVTVKLSPVLFTLQAGTGPIIVNDGGHLIGSGANSPGSTTLKMANGGNSEVIRCISTTGSTGWWHHAEVRNLRIDGNKANNSTGHGVVVYSVGETSLIQQLNIFNAAEAGVFISGSQAGTGTIENVTVNSNGTYGVQFDQFRSAMTLKNVGGDSNPSTFGFVNTNNNGGSITIIEPKSEAAGGPVFRFVGGTHRTNLLVLGGGILTFPSGTDAIFQIDADVGVDPYITAIGFGAGDSAALLIDDLKNGKQVLGPTTSRNQLLMYAAGNSFQYKPTGVVTVPGPAPLTTTKTATYQVLAADFEASKLIPVSSGTFTMTLVASGASQPPAGQLIRIVNYGTGVVTVAPSGQNINGAGGSLTIPASSATAPTSALIVSDGTNYVMSLDSVGGGGGGTVTASGSPSAGQYAQWSSATNLVGVALKGVINLSPNSVKFPATNPAILDNSENNSRLLFDNVTSQCAWWQFTMPLDYSSTPSFQYIYSMTSVTSGSHFMDVSAMVVTDSTADANTDSYDTVNGCDDATVPGTAGFTHTITCALTTNDSMAAGKFTKIKLCRDISDTAAGISEVLGALFTYTK